MSEESLSSMFKKVKDRISDEVSSATNRLQNVQIIDQLAASIQVDQPSSPPNKVHFSLIDDSTVDNQIVDIGSEESNSDNSPQHQLFNEKCIKPLNLNQDLLKNTPTTTVNKPPPPHPPPEQQNHENGDISSTTHQIITQTQDRNNKLSQDHPNGGEKASLASSTNNRQTLIAMLKESIKSKNSQIKSLKTALEKVDKFKGLGDELRNELKEIKTAHEKWTVSIAENKQVVHQELERKNIEIIKLKNEINDYQTKLQDSNTVIKQLKANIQDLGSKLVSTSAAHEKERETLTRDLTIARNNAIRQVQKEHEHNVEKIKLELEKSIEALKMALLTKDKELMEKAQSQQQMTQQNDELQRDLARCNEEIICQKKELEELKQKQALEMKEKQEQELRQKELEEMKHEQEVKQVTNSETMTDEPPEVASLAPVMTKDVESEYLKNVSGDEDSPDRSHVFYMEFPATWALEDIFQVFYQNGGVTVGRLGKTSALCALREPKHLKSVLKKIQKLNDMETNYKIYSYDTYLEKYKYNC